MKNNKVKFLLIIIISILLITIGICYFCNKSFDEDITSIEYSFGGGYGYIAQTESIYIIFNNDNKVEISAIEGKINKTISVSQNDMNELKNIIKENIPKLKKNMSNYDIMDGTSSYITINETYEFGGYSVSNKYYNKIESKIFEIVGYEEIEDVREKIKEYYDEY